MRQADALYQAQLPIGAADGIAQPRLSECLARWQAKAPEIPLDLSEMRAHELATALSREDVDIGFSFGVPEDDGIAQEEVWNYPLMALLPQGHELSRAQSLSLAELTCFPMITCHAGYKPSVRQQIDAILREGGRMPAIAGEASSFKGYVTRIAAGLGVGLADRGHAETLRREDIVSIPLVDAVCIRTFVLHKHQRFGLPVNRHERKG